MRATLGIVGGLGPEGTVQYYRKLSARLGALPIPHRRPGILVDHVWIDRFAALHRVGAEAAVVALLGDSIRRLFRGGADVALVAAVTPHRFLPALRRISPVPIVDLVEATRDGILAAGHRRVGLLGTRATLTEPFLKGSLEAAGIEVVVPPARDVAWLDDLIFGPLAAGERPPDVDRELRRILRALGAARVDAVVVACTDLMPFLPPEVPLVDAVDCHVALALASAGTNANG